MALYVGGTSVTGSQVLDATKLSGNLPALNASSLTNLDAADLSGTLPAINGSNLTNLPSRPIRPLRGRTIKLSPIKFLISFKISGVEWGCNR